MSTTDSVGQQAEPLGKVRKSPQTPLAAKGQPCPYCQQKMWFYGKTAGNTPNAPTREHIAPQAHTRYWRIAIVCRRCNGDKADRYLAEWLDELKERNDPRVEHVEQFMLENLDIAFRPGVSP